MKRALATLLLICILSPFSFMLYSCDEPGGETGGGSNSQDEQIFIPDISGTGREPVNISELQYTRPDTDNLIEAIRRASDIISKVSLNTPVSLRLSGLLSRCIHITALCTLTSPS